MWMTIDEVLKIMSMLTVYYGKPKGHPEHIAKAWHLVLKNYKYSDAEKGVIDFVVSDTREYAVFPTLGRYLVSVEKMKKMPYRIIGKIRQGKNYDDLDMIEQSVMSEEAFNRAKSMDDVTLIDNVHKIVGYISERNERSLTE